ncbi:MAG: hypothetical protein AABW79_05180 [Nanoarchaeota archaeon]
MKKTADKVKIGDFLSIGGEFLKVVQVELSDIGKQGTKKCRIELEKNNGEKVIVIRPADYPFEVK